MFKDTLSESLKKIKLNKKRGLKVFIIILVLSVFVATDVLMALRETGITMAGNASCGMVEHSHDGGCYKYVLDCNDLNKEHEHAEQCFNKVLICTTKPHIHNVNCYSDDTADVES